MPRYRFRWDNLPHNLLNSLTRDYDLNGQTAGEALRSWYGARPTERFIQENWDVIRESWLSRDTQARKSVVERLWNLDVGEGDKYPTQRATELEYLRSCRNARRLREVVLESFVERGEQEPDVLPVGSVRTTTVPLPRSSSTTRNVDSINEEAEAPARPDSPARRDCQEAFVRPVEGDGRVAGLRAAFPTVATAQLGLALQACEAPVTSIDDLLGVARAEFFGALAKSIIDGAPAIALKDSLPGLGLLADSAVPDGTFTTRPHNVLRRLRRGGAYTWGDVGSRSPLELQALTNLGTTSATEIVRVAARASVEAFSEATASSEDATDLRTAQSAATSAIQDSVRRALATVAAWLEVASEARTLGEGLLLAADHRQELPDDVARAWAVLSETPLSDVADGMTLDLPERLRELDGELSDERARMIFWARINIDAPSLESLAAPLGLSRERVRQVQVNVEEAVRETLGRPEFAALRWQAAMLGRTLGVGFPESAPWASDVLDDAARRGGLEWRERLRLLLLWIAGPYRRDNGGWLVRGDIPTRAAVMPAIDEDSQRVDEEKVEAALGDGGLALAAVKAWLDRHLPVRRIGEDMYLWEGSVADKAYVLLNAWGRPASADELSEEIGEGHGLRSTRTRLLEDARFKRVDRVRIGLQSWPYDEYTGIVDELAQEIESRGGESEIRDLVGTVAHRYRLKVRSVEAYTVVPRFVIEGSRIRLRGVDEPYQARRKLTDEPRCYLVSKVECTYRMSVDREVLRGSGRPIPEGLGSWLGVLPRIRRDYVFGHDVVPVTWPDSALMGPSIGSLRRIVVSLGGSDGDQLLLQFNREDSTGTAALVRPAELAAESPERRVATLTGVTVEGSLIDAVAQAIGVPTPAVKERLRQRGEADLLEIVSSPSLDLDAALSRLRDVL